MGTLFSGNIQSVYANKDGQAVIAYGADEPVQASPIGDRGVYFPSQSLSMGRVYPDPSNPYYKLIWFSGLGADGESIITFRVWHQGKIGEGPYMGWYGPFVATP